MTAPVLPRPDLAVLDGLLVKALADLRSARMRSPGVSRKDWLLAQERAESNLNALLDYRSVAARRHAAQR